MCHFNFICQINALDFIVMPLRLPYDCKLAHVQ